MYNVLIVEDNIVQGHMIANYISQEFPNIRIYSMVTTGKEAKLIIDSGEIDIILLDLLLPDISGIEILEYILKIDSDKYANSAIIYTSDMNSLAKVLNNLAVFDYVSKVDGLKRIKMSFKNMLEHKGNIEKKEFTRKKINDELYKIKYNFSYIGTKYLADCIFEVFISKNMHNLNLKKHVYPIVAKKYNQTVNSVKTNITRSTSNMYYDCNVNILKNYFGYNIVEKPKIKEMIVKVIENIEK